MGITGRPVSGRTWKTAQKPSRKQVLDGTVTLGKDWDKKVQERQKRKLVKEKELELKEEMKAKREADRVAREEREKRRQQNELRGTVYQEVKNTSILKTMSKKQLRQIKKTQVTKHGEVELVGAFDKGDADYQRSGKKAAEALRRKRGLSHMRK